MKIRIKDKYLAAIFRKPYLDPAHYLKRCGNCKEIIDTRKLNVLLQLTKHECEKRKEKP